MVKGTRRLQAAQCMPTRRAVESRRSGVGIWTPAFAARRAHTGLVSLPSSLPTAAASIRPLVPAGCAGTTACARLRVRAPPRGSTEHEARGANEDGTLGEL